MFIFSSVFFVNIFKVVFVDSYGKFVVGNIFKIMDLFIGEIVFLGEWGEIVVKGLIFMFGYIGIFNDEVLDEDGFFYIGDGGFFDEEGRLYWEGCLNDIIKIGGVNVLFVEIDIVIVQCLGVKIIKIVGIFDELLGELVVVCIVLLEGVELIEVMV